METSQESKMEMNFAKVVLLGDDPAIRSAIIQRLMNHGELPESAAAPEDRGITVHSQTYHISDNADTRVQFWNIEDQRVLRDMPEIIFSPLALYIIVRSNQSKIQEERAKFWIKLVQRHAPHAKIMQVVHDPDWTQSDVPPTGTLQLGFLHTIMLPRINVRQTTSEQFRQAFISPVLTVIWGQLQQDFLPDHEKTTLSALAELSDPWLSLSAFQQFCREHDTYAELVLEWMRDMGLVYCPKDSKLRGRVVLQPQWLTDALYALLYQKTDDIDGLRSRRSLLNLLPDSYSETDLPYLLRVLRKLSLSTPIEDNLEFVPMRCPEETISAEHDYEHDINTLAVRFTFDTLPVNLLHRLMIRRKNELDLKNASQSGAKFDQHVLQLSAVVSIRKDTLWLFIRRGNPRHSPHTYLTLLRSDVEAIRQQLNLPEPVCEIIYRKDGKDAAFDYDTLYSKLDAGETTIYARAFRQNISISEILGEKNVQADPQTAKLLADLANAFVDMQESPRYWDAPEYDRNTRIGRYLMLKGHTVRDQTMHGVYTGLRQQGQLDLLILRQDQQPWASCESLRIRSRQDLHQWNDHLEKLLTNYKASNAETCSIRFLISYADCEPHEFQRLWSVYNDHMRDHEPEHGKAMGAYQHILPLPEQPEFLRVAQCSYDIGGSAVTVYHYFVRIGPTTDGSAEEAMQERLAKNTAEIEMLKDQLLRERQARDRAESDAHGARVELDAMMTSSKRQIEQLQAELAHRSSHPFAKLFPPKPVPTPPEDDNDDDKQVDKEYRVIIMGDSEAGKSQLLYRLRHPGRDPKTFSGDVTPGIDIASRCYEIDSRSGDNGSNWVRVNFWDFGGQEILHSMHRLFLASNTLYVIVLNTRNDNQEEQARFWLHYVALYATGAPVVLVLNKIDQNPDAALNLAALRRSFRHDADIQGILRLSAREWDKDQFEELFLKKLLSHIEANMDDSHFFTKAELKIRDLIRARHGDQQIMEMADFRKLCKKEDLPEDYDFNELAKRFHRAGMFVYFQTRTNMILNPEWITRAIYRILERGARKSTNGIIDYEDIENILYDDEEVNYGKNQVDFVMKIMRIYGLSFQYRPQGTTTREQEFIPMLCKREEPTGFEDFLKDDDSIQMQLVFPYLPAGVLYQLVTDLHQDASQQQWRAKDFHVWMSGIMFETDDGIKAAVVRERDRMLFYARSENRAAAIDYLKTLCKWVELIAKGDMYNANVRQRLLGYHISGKVEFFDYDRLTLSKEKDLSYVMSKFKPGPLFVQDVLDQREATQTRERDELLRLVLRGARAIQEDREFWKMDENGRNRELVRSIHEPFIPKDQHEAGLSEFGGGPGELDILIENQRHIPIAIVEALNTTSLNTINWRGHLNKLMDRYNTSGLPTLILVSYIKCPKEKFAEKFGDTLDHWKTLSPTGFDGCFRGVDTFLMEDCPELIHITRAEYVRNHFTMSLYHFMIHIGDHS